MAKETQKEWESQYNKRIRIKTDDLEWIKKNKVNVSSAAFLHYIIEQYKKNG